MNTYYFWGTISSVFFLSSIPAILHQLSVIWKRKRLRREQALDEAATQSISLNQVFSSYCAVYSFFLFGLVLDSPDPFLMYPRAIVGILLYAILLEIYSERRSRAARASFAASSLSLIGPLALIATGTRASPEAQSASNALVCGTTILMAQGAVSQWLLLKRSGKRGAVSLPMHLALYGKDFTGLMFGLQIGTAAWSIVLMHASNLIMRAPVIYSYVRLAR
jgi:hypothetical protein